MGVLGVPNETRLGPSEAGGCGCSLSRADAALVNSAEIQRTTLRESLSALRLAHPCRHLVFAPTGVDAHDLVAALG